MRQTKVDSRDQKVALAHQGRSMLLRFAAWLSVLALALASWTPGDEMIRTGANGEVEHVLAYFISAFLLLWSYPQWTQRQLGSALVIYAGILEVGQIYAPGRHSQFGDFAASSLGVLIGVLMVSGLRQRMQKRSRLPQIR
jgi:peptidoglycan/LPS O-acetylase OafA/YrhL